MSANYEASFPDQGWISTERQLPILHLNERLWFFDGHNVYDGSVDRSFKATLGTYLASYGIKFWKRFEPGLDDLEWITTDQDMPNKYLDKKLWFSTGDNVVLGFINSGFKNSVPQIMNRRGFVCWKPFVPSAPKT